MSGLTFVPLRRLVDRVVRGRTVMEAFDDDGEYPWWNPTALTERLEIGEPKRRVPRSAVLSGQFLLAPAGSTAFAFIGNVGRCGLLTEPGVVNEQQVCLVPNSLCDSRYLAYLLRAYASRLDALAFHTVIRYLPLDDLLSLSVPSHDVESQRSIVGYLDAETARIDALIAKKKRMIELMRARQHQIAESDLADLRQQAVLQPLKYLVHESDHRRGNEDNRELLSVSIHVGVVPRSEASDRESRAENFSNYKTCEPGDIVINRMRAFQGAVGVVRVAGVVSPEYTVLRLGPRLEAEYTHFLMRSHWFVAEMTARIRGIGAVDQGQVRTPRLNFADLREILVPVPSTSEQHDCVDRWRAAELKVSTAVGRLEQQHALLTEHRHALMTAAVSGELTVAGVAG